jgi:DNA-binding YbaB/EbfC family protein
MNLQKLMRQAQEMQNRLQGELETLEVEAAVGGGMVAVTMNGHKQLLKVKIEREVLDPDDPEMLQDLVLAAVNEATRKVDEAVQSKIGGMAGGMGGGLPGMFR